MPLGRRVAGRGNAPCQNRLRLRRLRHHREKTCGPQRSTLIIAKVKWRGRGSQPKGTGQKRPGATRAVRLGRRTLENPGKKAEYSRRYRRNSKNEIRKSAAPRPTCRGGPRGTRLRLGGVDEEGAFGLEGAELGDVAEPTTCVRFGSGCGVGDAFVRDLGKARSTKKLGPFVGGQEMRGNGQKRSPLVA